MMNKVMSISDFRKSFSFDEYEIEINFKDCDFQYEVSTEDLLNCLEGYDRITVEELDSPTDELMGYVKAIYDNMDSLEWEHIGNNYFGFDFEDTYGYYEHINSLIDEMRGK